jgi:hypothetical protein
VFPTDNSAASAATAKPAAAEFDLLSDLEVLGAAGGVPKHAYTHPARQEAERVEHEDRERELSATATRCLSYQKKLQIFAT